MNDPIDLTQAKVLLVDDQPTNLKLLRQALAPADYNILVASDGERCLAIAQRAIPDLILLDVMMPGIDGFATCRQLKADPTTAPIPVLFITARSETEDVVTGFQAGGTDYILKPFRSEEVLARVQTHLERAFLERALRDKNAALEKEINQRKILTSQKQQLSDQLSMISQREADRWGIPGFVGTSSLLKNVLREIQLLQNSHSTSVLVSGESGTGKELVARALHFGSDRAKGPFVPVNCSAVPAELVESQFFGHAKGAFTGANTQRKGFFELAHGGTLFLDEVGDMPLNLQAKLLRVLEDSVVVPVGADQGRPVDVRVVSATNADLQDRVADGTFRQDLYFRLAAFPVFVPPLRQRPEDIPLLVDHFLTLLTSEMGFEPTVLDDAALALLQAYPFPGNIRELKNIVARALLESAGGEIGVEHLHCVRPSTPQTTSATRGSAIASSSPAEVLPLNLVEAEKLLMRRALEESHGNISVAARLLGTNRPRVYRFLQEEEGKAE